MMLFLTIYTHKEGKLEEVIKRRREIDTGVPDGIKIIGEWVKAAGNGGYLIWETQNPTFEWTMKWRDILNIELIPIVDIEDVKKLMNY